MFIKGNVKLCSGNRSFCRSIPKVKPLNQCGVIHPKPLLSCWKRNGNCTSKGRGQPRGEGSSGMDLGSAPGGLPRAQLPTRARLGSTLGMLLSAPFPSQAPLRTGVMVVMWPHGMIMMVMVMMMMQPKRAHPGEGQTEVWVPGWDCCPLPQPAPKAPSCSPQNMWVSQAGCRAPAHPSCVSPGPPSRAGALWGGGHQAPHVAERPRLPAQAVQLHCQALSQLSPTRGV